MNKKSLDINNKDKSDSSIYKGDSVKEAEKKKLQEFYSSLLGNDPNKIKTNARILRRKIYWFGLTTLAIAVILYFFVLGNVSFVKY